MFQLRVVFGEEPWLEHTHGDDWRQSSVLNPARPTLVLGRVAVLGVDSSAC